MLEIKQQIQSISVQEEFMLALMRYQKIESFEPEKRNKMKQLVM